MNRLFKTVTNSILDNFPNEKVVPFKEIDNISQEIIIEAFSVNMSIGILPEEKQEKQNVLIDLMVQIEPKNTYGDDIANTVSYADIVEGIKELAQSQHFNLVETVAEKIADICFSYSLVRKCEITVKKPDIMSEVENVGFKLIQMRSA